MDKTQPEISVFTSMPNNGYYALVFTDAGVVMSANCNKKDAYEGLLEACARFLLDCVEDKRPSLSLFDGHTPTPDEKAKIDNYAELVSKVNDAFCEALKSRLVIGSAVAALEANGIPHTLAKLIATGVEAFPESLKKVFPDDGCDEEESDDSDDEYNLD